MSRPSNVRRSVSHLLTTAAVLCALALAIGPVAAQEATPTATDSLLAGPGYPELTVTTDGTDYDLPAEVAAGRYRVVLQNDNEQSADLEFYQLPEGVTIDDLLALFEQAEEGTFPEYFFDMVFNGGPVSDAGQSGEVILDLTPGEWVANLLTYSDREDVGDDTNFPKTFTVTGEMPAVKDPTGAIEVGLTEMTFVLPETIAAGPRVWKVVNTGLQPHHLLLSQVPDGTTEEQVLALVSTFFGPPASPEASAEPALAFEDVIDIGETLILSRGQANWIEFDLAPGTYAAICFMPAAGTDMPHAMMGMISVFTVGA